MIIKHPHSIEPAVSTNYTNKAILPATLSHFHFQSSGRHQVMCKTAVEKDVVGSAEDYPKGH